MCKSSSKQKIVENVIRVNLVTEAYDHDRRQFFLLYYLHHCEVQFSPLVQKLARERAYKLLKYFQENVHGAYILLFQAKPTHPSYEPTISKPLTPPSFPLLSYQPCMVLGGQRTTVL